MATEYSIKAAGANFADDEGDGVVVTDCGGWFDDL